MRLHKLTLRHWRGITLRELEFDEGVTAQQVVGRRHPGVGEVSVAPRGQLEDGRAHVLTLRREVVGESTPVALPSFDHVVLFEATKPIAEDVGGDRLG